MPKRAARSPIADAAIARRRELGRERQRRLAERQAEHELVAPVTLNVDDVEDMIRAGYLPQAAELDRVEIGEAATVIVRKFLAADASARAEAQSAMMTCEMNPAWRKTR